MAHAHDAEEPDAEWYNSLKSPYGVGCCAQDHDCEIVDDDYRGGPVPGSYIVKWHGREVTVPPRAVLKRSDNPTGHPVLCMHYSVPQCFVLPAEG
jgi:hypothetical protein